MVIQLSECALSKEVFLRLLIKNLEKLQGALLGPLLYLRVKTSFGESVVLVLIVFANIL
jgi:hypothetical protein